MLPEPTLKVGFISDVQYADCDARHGRCYRDALTRLAAAVEHLNRLGPHFVVNMGDLIDRDFVGFGPVLTVLSELKAPVFHVLGNHDFSVPDCDLGRVPHRLGLAARYYAFSRQNWRFIVLDGTDVSTYASSTGSAAQAHADEILAKMRTDERPNAEAWNGAIGRGQLNWLCQQLDAATCAGQNVAVLVHFPIYPVGRHNLWNDLAVLHVLDRHPCVRVCFSAHNHAGSYARCGAVHFITFKAMVDAEASTAYAMADIGATEVFIRGFGREDSRRLTFEGSA